MAAPASYVFRPFTQAPDPQQIYLRRFAGQIVAIEGNIGVGKSTLGRDLVRFLERSNVKALFLPEQFPTALLEDFLAYEAAHPGTKNPHAFALQMTILDCRLDTYTQALQRAREGAMVIIDRSLPGDYVFARLNYERGNINDAEWRQYLEKVERTHLLAPTAIIYLDATLDTCKQRITKRGRPNEDKYTDDYLASVQSHYEEVMKTLEHPILRLTWDTAKEHDEAAFVFVFRALDALMHVSTSGAPRRRIVLHV